jgi:hypothetical protein
MITEAIYAYFRRNPDKVPQGAQGADGKPMPGAGCGAEPAPAQKSAQGLAEGAQGTDPGQAPGQAPSWGQIAHQARAVEKIVGKGSATCGVIAPAKSYRNFADLLRHGARMADTGAGHSVRSYARASRRDASDPKILLPGYLGGAPKLAVVIDASGSMERDWLSKIANDVIRLAKAFRSLKIYLVVHTERVVWQGWITDRTVTKDIALATAFSGGTEVGPAYEALRQLGTWDAILHCTDCEVERPWPAPPTRKLIVGAWGSGAWRPYSQPPAGTQLVPCRDPDMELAA